MHNKPKIAKTLTRGESMRHNRKIKEPIIAITKGMTEGHSLEKALDMLPVDKIIKKGDKVIITPNGVKDKKPKDGVVSGPKTLKKLIQYVKQREPSEIYIAFGSGGTDSMKVLQTAGFDKIIEEENVKFVDMNYGPFFDIELDGPILKSTPLNKVIEDADVIISFTQLKYHEEATITASIKNICLGYPPASVHGFIRSFAKQVPIDLSIISMDKAMIGTGPIFGKAVDTPGLIIAGTYPVAADCIGARLLGFLPQAVNYLYMLYKDNLGEAEPQKMTIKGLDVKEAEQLFSKCAYGDKKSILDQKYVKDLHDENKK